METQTQEVQSVDATAKVAQKDAVYRIITETLGTVALAEGQKLKDLVTKEVRKAVRPRLFSAIRAGEIRLKKPMDDSKLKKYCSGLINNWLKKDKRFN